MASTIKVTNIDTPDNTGNITVDRPLSGSGASLTALNATNLASGTVPTARLGSGTANSGVFLRGDGTWAAAGGGVDGITSSASSTSMNISSAGEITKPLNPTALATLDGDHANVTGDETQYNLTGITWNEYKDYNNDFSNGTFTAPVEGVYLVTATIQCKDFTNSHAFASMFLVTSDRNIRFHYYDPYYTGGSNYHLQATGSVLVDLDASDTANLMLEVGNHNKQVDIVGAQTWFGITLIG